ncbi:MAG TPA: hypothetical protein VK513_08210 [Terriglobales bacterium]|nr:hypothetical protein [Terriglobales bacterium]
MRIILWLKKFDLSSSFVLIFASLGVVMCREYRFKFAIALAAILCILLPRHFVAAAQEVGFRDLTKQVVTSKSPLDALREFKDPDCPTGPVEIVADAVATAIRDLQLEIVELRPTKLGIDDTRSMMLRLRNTLNKTAKIPWQMEPKPFNSLATSNDERDSVSIGVQISDQEKPLGWKPIGYLRGGAQLFGAAESPESFKDIAPGQWVTLKIRTEVDCRSNNDLCDQVENGGRFWISVSWGEAKLEVSHSKCHLGTTEYGTRSLVSKPVAVRVLP